MYIYELFKNLDSRKIVEKMTSTNDFFWQIDWDMRMPKNKKAKAKEIIKQKYIDAINEINKQTYETDDNSVMIAYKRRDGENTIITVSIILKENFDEIYEDLSNLKDFHEFKNPAYGLLFTKRSEILGYQISPVSLELCDEYEIAGEILHEITFFGIEESSCNKEMEEQLRITEEAAREIEEGTAVTYSWEEVMESLRDEYDLPEEEKTPEEEAAEHQKILEEITFNIAKEINMILETIKRYKDAE